MTTELHITEINNLLTRLSQIILKQRKIKKFPLSDIVNYDSVKNNLEEVKPQKKGDIKHYRLKEEYEFSILNSLFAIDNDKVVYHYTSVDAIFNILKTGKLQLSPLAGLNDKLEIGLINRFMGRGTPMPQYYNSFFVFCCSERKDDLNQWRLYGDNGKGVMLTFRVDKSSPYSSDTYISETFYNIDFFKLLKRKRDEFKKRHNFSFGLREIDKWKYFFKDSQFTDEEEVRIIHYKYEDPKDRDYLKFKLNYYKLIVPYKEFALDSKIILQEKLDSLPIKLTGITLGPKMSDAKENQTQLHLFINRLTIKNETNFPKKTYTGTKFEFEYPEIKVDVSKIKNYR